MFARSTPRRTARLIATAAIAAAAVTVGPAAGSAMAATTSVSGAQVVEGNAGVVPLTFTVTYTREVAADAASPRIQFRTRPMSADPDIDYREVNTTVPFNDVPVGGTRSLFVPVPVIGDTAPEANETLAAAFNGELGTGTIVDDDTTTTPLTPTRQTPTLPDLNIEPNRPELPDLEPTLPGPPSPKG
jgi:lipoprotein-anchoring transpeptidase ErfK/SrfK